MHIRVTAMESNNSFVLQMETVTVNRNPRRTEALNTCDPEFCYVEVDRTLSDKIKTNRSLIDDKNLDSLSIIDDAPEWRFSANRYTKPRKILNSSLNISRNYVWFSAALYEGFDD